MTLSDSIIAGCVRYGIFAEDTTLMTIEQNLMIGVAR